MLGQTRLAVPIKESQTKVMWDHNKTCDNVWQRTTGIERIHETEIVNN